MPRPKTSQAGQNQSGRKSWAEIVIPLLIAFLFIVGVLRLITGSWWPAILAVVLFALGVLSARFPIIGRAVDVAWSKYLRFTVWALLGLLPASVALWGARFILARSTLWLQTALLVLWGLLLCSAVVLISTEEWRTRLFTRLQRVGAFTPWTYSFGVLALGIYFFGTVTLLLMRAGAIVLEGSPERVFDFYLWHFLDAVPLLHINETLLWNQPMIYRQTGVGWLLLTFKAAIILPVIATFGGYWQFRREQQTKVR